MPPAGYPAFLQYLQSGRVRKTHRSEDLWVQVESSDAEAPHIEVGSLPAEANPKARANCVGRWRMWGSHLSHRPTWEDSLLNCSGAWNLKPYWGKPAVRNFRGGGWKRGHGSRTEAHVEMRGIATGP